MNGKLVKEFADKVLPEVRLASLLMMSEIEIKQIAEFFDKCSNEKLKAFLEEKRLNEARLKVQGVAVVKKIINDIREKKEYSPSKRSRKDIH